MLMWLKILVILQVFSVFAQENANVHVNEDEIPELAYLDRNADPCEDFYEFTCGNFENVKPRPENLPLWDSFLILQQELDALLTLIVESPERRNDPVALRKSKAVYSACMNTKYSDQLRTPEVEVLKDAGVWPLITDSSHQTNFSWNVVGNLAATYGVQLFFTIEVIPNLFDASQNIIYISRDKILNPALRPELKDNSEDFLNAELHKRTSKHPYEVFLTKIAIELRNAIGSFKNEQLIAQEVSEIFEFFKVLQPGGILDPRYRGSMNMTTVELLQQWTDAEIGTEINLNWHEYFNSLFGKSGVTVDKDTLIIITDFAPFYGVLNLIKQTSPDMLKNFVMSRILTYTAPDSNNNIRRAYEQFRVDMGDIIYSRPEYCLRKVLDTGFTGLSFALTYEYQRYHFNPNKIQAAIEMLNNLNDAFDAIVNESDWLDDSTKAAALEKANQMITLLAYPEFSENPELLDKYYENVRICKWDHFGNSQRLRAFRLATNLALLGQPRNREIWQLSPLNANAYYNAQHNRILLPVSMLNPSFYTGSISAIDYGRLGSIIGHEITHGFDNQGMQYDGQGSLTSGWWTTETMEQFREKTACFLEQYGKYYIPEIDKYVNATLSLRENIADNGGLREAYIAFKKVSNHRRVKDFTPDQLFFVGFGTMWCTSQTNDYLNKIQNSNYPPAKYRVIGTIQNNEEFARAFNCPVGSKMNPADKCILW